MVVVAEEAVGWEGVERATAVVERATAVVGGPESTLVHNRRSRYHCHNAAGESRGETVSKRGYHDLRFDRIESYMSQPLYSEPGPPSWHWLPKPPPFGQLLLQISYAYVDSLHVQSTLNKTLERMTSKKTRVTTS